MASLAGQWWFTGAWGSLADDRALAVLYRPLALTAVLYPPSHNQGRLTIGRHCQEGGEVLNCKKGPVYLFSSICKFHLFRKVDLIGRAVLCRHWVTASLPFYDRRLDFLNYKSNRM